LSPLEPGIKEICHKFKKVVCVEMNYSDEPGGESRRYSQLATILRAHTLIDIDSFSRVYGKPLRPVDIEEAINSICK
jgi:2-oxoglutarate ferredoxin oxidoreductase subunit alpha